LGELGDAFWRGGHFLDRIATLRFPSGCLWQAVSLRSADRIFGD
jgi:hypothetical protein